MYEAGGVGSMAPNPNIGGSSGARMSGHTPPSRDTSPLHLHRRTTAAATASNYQQLNTQRHKHMQFTSKFNTLSECLECI